MVQRQYSTLNRTKEGGISKRGQKDDTGTYITILLAAAVPCFAMLSASGLLIGITLKNLITLNPGLPELRTEGNIPPVPRSIISNFITNGGSYAYYVQFNPSSLSTIASAAGKLLPYLSSTVTGLAAFFAANFINKMSRERQINELLTPKQMSLLLSLLVSGWHGFWDAICYRMKKGNKFNSPLFGVVTTLTFTTFLGIIIPVVDTWFGIVVIPSEQTQLQVISPPVHSFGRGLVSSNCTKDGTGPPCDIITVRGESYLISASEAFKVLHNVSAANRIFYFPTQSSQELLYLGDATSSSNIDFMASTFAVSTQCQPITYSCTHMYPAETRFNCTPALAGDFNTLSSPVGIKLFSNSSLTESLPFTYQNPVYFATWAVREQADSNGLLNDSGVAYHSNTVNTMSWILNCSSTVYEASYIWVNGTVIEFNTTMANNTLGGIMSGPFGNDRLNAALHCAANFASVGSSSTEIAETTATYMSRAALSLSIGAISSRKNLLEQSRSKVLLTRVPVIPFYTLIAFKALYALGVVTLAVATTIWTHSIDSAGVRSQLTIDALVATIFREEQLEEPLVESDEDLDQVGKIKEGETKVAVLKTEQGKWSYVAITLNEGKSVVKFV